MESSCWLINLFFSFETVHWILSLDILRGVNLSLFASWVIIMSYFFPIQQIYRVNYTYRCFKRFKKSFCLNHQCNSTSIISFAKGWLWTRSLRSPYTCVSKFILAPIVSLCALDVISMTLTSTLSNFHKRGLRAYNINNNTFYSFYA